MNIAIIRDSSSTHFLEKATAFLYQDEPANSLMIGLCNHLANVSIDKISSALFMRVLRDGQLVAAAVQSPPRNLILTYANDPELRQLAGYLSEAGVDIPGVVGPSNVVDTFTQIWSERAGTTFNLVMSLGILQVERVNLPVVEGTLSPAGQSHVPIVAEWMVAFGNESLPHNERLGIKELLLDAQRIINGQGAYLWLADGEPVSMVHVARQTKNGASLNAVLTPKDKRNRGYASAAVAHLSQQLLNSGKRFCVLYTDLSNPTSNKIYKNIGYKQVGDSKNYLFTSGQ